MAEAPPSSPQSTRDGITSLHSSFEENQNSDKTTAVTINSIDDAIERYMSSAYSSPIHLLFPLLSTLAGFFDGQQSFLNVFSDSPPAWHCTSPACNMTISSSSSHSPPCSLPSSSWSFTHSRSISTISDFSLECSSPFLRGLPSSSLYAGSIVGSLFATLADSRLGRKGTLVISTFAMSLFTAAAALSPNVAVYAALRFLCGIARANIGSSNFILASELVPRRLRSHVSAATFICFDLGFLTLPAISFFNRDKSWRLLYIYTSAPCFFFSILIHFFMRESPRWLLVKGRRKEAVETLKKIAIFSETETFADLKAVVPEKTESNDSPAILLSSKGWALRRLAALMTTGVAIGMMYYGMPLNLGNVNASLYLTVALNAGIETPAAFFFFFLAKMIGRRSSLLGLMAFSAGCSLACTALGNWSVVMVELVAYFMTCTAYDLVLLYCVELFPTCVRSSAMASVRQSMMLGGVIAPVLVAEGRRRKFLSFGVFGIVMILCGFFVVFLPETKGRGITDTMEEEENKAVPTSRSP